jgi:hypothetical protein
MSETSYKIKAKSCFEDCSPLEIASILSRRHFSQMGRFTELEYKQSLVVLLVYGMTNKKFDSFSPEEKIRHINYIRWAITDTISVRPFENILINGRRFAFPKDDFEDTIAIEYSIANMFYLAFSKPESQSTDTLYDLLSVFVRPVDSSYSRTKKAIRIKYDTDTALGDAIFLKNNMPFGLVIAFLQWFEKTNNAFIAKNEILFEKSGGRQMFANGEGWIAMLEDVAETGVYGDFDAVCNQNLHTVFMYLRHCKIKIDRQIEDQKSQTND